MAALQTYSPPADRIVHTTQVDFLSRSGFEQPVYIVQGDVSLPIVAVELYKNGTRYAVPATASGNVRWKKPNPSNEFVYNPLLGVSEDRMTAYFEVTQQMALISGEPQVILEIMIGANIAGSSHIPVYIDRNPVQEGDIESSNEVHTLQNLVDAAAASASAAAGSQTEAKKSENAAKSSADAAKASQDAAKTSQDAAKSSADAAEASRTAAKTSQDAAATSATAAAASQKAAASSQDAAKNSQDAAAGSADEAAQSATESEDWSNVSKSWAVGEGMGDQRPNEATDNSKWYAQKSKESADSSSVSAKTSTDQATAAAESASAAESQADRAQDIADGMQTDWDAIHKALEDAQASAEASDSSALRSEAAADSAEFDADRAEEAANRAQSIAQGAKGYYETPETLNESVPEGAAGDWAIVGSTDTIWVWDSDSGGWKDSHQATDLSNYYTKDQADEENNKLLAQITQETDEKLAAKANSTDLSNYYTKDQADEENNKLLAQITQETDEKLAAKANSTDLEPLESGIAEAQTEAAAAKEAAASATSRSWTCAVPSTAWTDGDDTWAGIHAKYKADLETEGVTEKTKLGDIFFEDGDLNAYSLWKYLRPRNGIVTLWAIIKPAANFTISFTEVK